MWADETSTRHMSPPQLQQQHTPEPEQTASHTDGSLVTVNGVCLVLLCNFSEGQITASNTFISTYTFQHSTLF